MSQSRKCYFNAVQAPKQTKVRAPKHIRDLLSMEGRGHAMDNIFTERLWRTIKYDEVYLHEYASPKEAYRQLANYILFYNFERPYQALKYLTPAHVVDLNYQTLTNRTTLN